MHRPSTTLALAAALLAVGCGSSSPPPEKEPPPAHRPVPKPKPAPEPAPAAQAKPESTPPPPPSRAKTPEGPGYKKVIFLNGFSRAEGDKVWQALESSGEFSEVMSGGGTEQRIVLECKYHGSDVQRSVTQLIRELGIRHHFKAADIKHHVEVLRD